MSRYRARNESVSAAAGLRAYNARPMSRRSAKKSARVPRSAAPAVETIALVSLGCPKNLVDSEKMLGLLAQDGLIPVAADYQADAVVINTCGFLEASKDESLEVIRQAAARKRRGEIQRLVVAGCLVQRHRAKMLEWCPDIDALIGVFDRDHIVEAVRGGRGGSSDVASDVPVYSSIAANDTIAQRARGLSVSGYHENDTARLRLTPRHYAYLRISEGCNQNCAFCTIPSIRGKMRSKPMPAILAEASELLSDGAFELNLIGQDTTSFGQDIGYGPGLSGMLTELDRLAARRGGGWIRLMYAYPSCFTDEMIDTLAALPNVLKYIDMPLQHINDRILDSMKRRTSRRLIQTLLQKLRDRVPGIAIRTTFITGYPTETDAEHQELVSFIGDFGFDNLGAFQYSPEPGTPAGTLHAGGGAIEPHIVQERYEQIMLTQQQVVLRRNAELARSRAEFDVLIDRADDQRRYVGRTCQQAPDIDGVTYVRCDPALAPGELVRCAIVDSDGYDLIARPARELSRKVALPLA
jgi:ribosomal protein S12 methylthiotransferase